MRKRYTVLLGDGKYSPNKVYVRASDNERTIVSAAANLRGLFPNQPILNDEFGRIPIPIHTVPLEFDNIIGIERPCLRYVQAVKNIFTSTEYESERAKVARYIKLIADNTG